MEEQGYLISDAAKLVAVEPHVLRYWEEELGIPVARTQLGHRYYTREDIELFQKVKQLKGEGLQLRAIRVVVQRIRQTQEETKGAPFSEQPVTSLAAMEQNARRLQLFRELVTSIVEKVVKDNNRELQTCIEEAVSRETEYLLQIQEQREEERFRRLDEAIREHQKNSRYVAASRERQGFWERFRKR